VKILSTSAGLTEAVFVIERFAEGVAVTTVVTASGDSGAASRFPELSRATE